MIFTWLNAAINWNQIDLQNPWNLAIICFSVQMIRKKKSLDNFVKNDTKQQMILANIVYDQVDPF